jgi:hypothetical protein
MIDQTNAVRLAWWTESGFVTSPYGYSDQEAATRAAPVLNQTRVARGNHHYTHIVQMHGTKPVDVKPLEAVA